MLVYWVWFAELKELTLLQKHRLLRRFRDPEEIYHTAETVFRKMELPEKQVRALQDKDLKEAEKILTACEKKNIGILPAEDAAYPEKLRNTADAPIVLYYNGILPDWNAVPFIGIVGTRKASAYGLQVAFQMGNQIAAGGGCVVSGGAAGADTAALQGALEAGSPVVCVLGCGVDVVYPYSNRNLFDTVSKRGCLISEYPPGTKALGWHFPARNRIISGISSGVLVAEAPERSGALITARHALEQGRDVFVVPGNINNSSCVGSNALLQEGAIPALSGWDVLESYKFLYPDKIKKPDKSALFTAEHSVAKVAQKPIKPEKKKTEEESTQKKFIDNRTFSTYSVLNNNNSALNETEQAVLAQLTREPQEPADLIAKLNFPSGKVLSVLTMLTVKGFVCKNPGGRFSLK